MKVKKKYKKGDEFYFHLSGFLSITLEDPFFLCCYGKKLNISD